MTDKHKVNKEEQFEILRKLNKNPEATQRELSSQLGYSLGKINYCLRSLKKRFCKIAKFS